nr:putative reverse transcriptase domain-containing protein [Tanacetum cinerariifolium]
MGMPTQCMNMFVWYILEYLEDEQIKEEPLKEPKDEGLLEESEEEADSDLLSNARSRLGPVESEYFVVYCDTSNQGLRYVLIQRGKANVVADTCSRKEIAKSRQVRAMSMSIRSSVTEKILATQDEASKVGNATAEMLRGLAQQIEKKEDGGLYFIDRGWDSIDRRCKDNNYGRDSCIKVVLIKEKLKAVRDRQKSNADNRRKPLEFEVENKVLLKVSP